MADDLRGLRDRSLLGGAARLARTRAPAVFEIAALGVLAAWYNSLQHGGDPRPSDAVAAANTALASIPLGLVVPFASYREIHLAHHRSTH